MARNDYGDRYIGMRNVPAWHNGGITKPEGVEMTCVEAITEADMDFPYVMSPIGYALPDGTFVNSGDRSVVLRGPSRGDDSWAELGVVSNGYRFLQNRELAEGLDAISKATGWKFDTAGALGKGETVWMALRTGQSSIFGDSYDDYLTVSDGKCAKRALQIDVCKVRRVCQNTLLSGDASAAVKITVAHDDNVAGEYRFWLDMIKHLEQANREANKALEMMASVEKISDKVAQKIIADAFVLPTLSQKSKQAQALLSLPTLDEATRAMASERFNAGDAKNASYREQIAKRRLATFELYTKFNAGQEISVTSGGQTVDAETLEQIRNTPYAVVQAVSEFVDWCGSTNARVQGVSSLFGNGADIKQRAWDSAVKVAEKAAR